MSRPYSANDVIGFTSVSTNALATVFTQGPKIACDDVLIAKTATDLYIAASVSPGTNYLAMAQAQIQWIPTGGNLNNLWFSNSGNAVITVGLMWRIQRAIKTIYY
jgi:hypothetical protein